MGLFGNRKADVHAVTVRIAEILQQVPVRPELAELETDLFINSQPYPNRSDVYSVVVARVGQYDQPAASLTLQTSGDPPNNQAVAAQLMRLYDSLCGGRDNLRVTEMLVPGVPGTFLAVKQGTFLWLTVPKPVTAANTSATPQRQPQSPDTTPVTRPTWCSIYGPEEWAAAIPESELCALAEHGRPLEWILANGCLSRPQFDAFPHAAQQEYLVTMSIAINARLSSWLRQLPNRVADRLGLPRAEEWAASLPTEKMLHLAPHGEHGLDQFVTKHCGSISVGTQYGLSFIGLDASTRRSILLRERVDRKAVLDARKQALRLRVYRENGVRGQKAHAQDGAAITHGDGASDAMPTRQPPRIGPMPDPQPFQMIPSYIPQPGQAKSFVPPPPLAGRTPSPPKVRHPKPSPEEAEFNWNELT